MKKYMIEMPCNESRKNLQQCKSEIIAKLHNQKFGVDRGNSYSSIGCACAPPIMLLVAKKQG